MKINVRLSNRNKSVTRTDSYPDEMLACLKNLYDEVDKVYEIK